ncbi:hypothetical protein R3W88_030568 [Solanum pinnatisectum]|uniref:Jacalin-type lectin domain-containing protein n=1 Tax=Solanum pinnatisectum TaxID=50273 RepID=A0AAV9LIW5_9SOLN|nr:hypothetical protein R3W88_030561 [Solanum pinnatisectum]KAK4725647.1 hypothetical protein R3W88_030564 [Solanum pinnatisectum]KAK4725651.1 hypothetical protein R3W88_030568 [Solanum pinnatisectum]
MNNQIDMIKYGVKKEGTVWDEKGKSETAKIFIYSDVTPILFVHFNSCSLRMVVLDYPSEFLTEIQGMFYRNGLRSIKFVTNKNVYGSYGSDKIDPKCTFI